jgi:L-malate glycosyltransferase
LHAKLPQIVHVDTATEWRGGQKQLLLLVKGMVERGWDALVACPNSGALWKALEDQDVRLLDIPPGFSLRTSWILNRSNADLIAAHTSHAHACAAVLSCPLVVHRRVDFRPSGGWKYRRPEAYVAVSNAVAEVLKKTGAGNVSVVYDGVSPLVEMEPAPDGPSVLAVGACVPHKGHHVLSQAASLLPGVDIGVAGEGRLRFPGLRYLGQRTDIAALFASADVFVHPSVEEGMGQVVVEAMLSGVPVITSDAGGLPEVVGEYGVVVPRGDAHALAEAIGAGLSQWKPSLERAASRAAEYFSVESMVDRTLEVYSEILESSSSSMD